MIFLISLAIAVLFVLTCAKPLKRYPIPFYAVVALVAAAVFVCTKTGVRFPSFFNTWIWPLVSRGGLAGALFILVMVTGALPNGSKAMKLLMPIRGELSILACILTLGHNAAYGLTYFRFLFTAPARLPANQLAAAVCSLIMIVLMLPLFVTSFPAVRKKMAAKSWKKLQRFAYVFYALLYVHIMLLTVPSLLKGHSGYTLTVLVYSAIFIGYAICRVMKAAALKTKTHTGLPRRQLGGVCGALVLSVCMTVGLVAYAASKPDEPAVLLADNMGQETEPSPALPDSDAPEEGDSEDGNSEDGDSADQDTPEAETSDASTPETEPSSDASASTQSEPPAVSQQVSEAPQAQTSAPAVSSKPEPETTPTSQPQPSATAASTPEPTPTPAPTPTPTPTPEPVRIYKNGTFTGSGMGYESTITASVTIQDDVIVSISISGSDDEPYFSEAKTLVNRILSAQSTSVDSVSGATYSSAGILTAVKNALASAKN